MNRTRKIVVTIWVLLGLSVMALLDWQFGGLRVAGPYSDLVAGNSVSLLLGACVILLCFLPRGRNRFWAFVCLVPPSAACLLGTLCLDFVCLLNDGAMQTNNQ